MERKAIFASALARAFRHPAAWLTAAAFTALLALAAALPHLGGMTGLIDHRYEPGSLVATLNETFRADNRLALDALSASSRAMLSALAFVAMLAGAFFAGGWLTLFHERREGETLRRFFHGGARFFGRFVRVWLTTLALLTLCGWVVYGDPWTSLVRDGLLGIKDPEELVSERSAVTLTWIQDGLHFLLFGLVLCWADYTRTRLAMHGGSSVFWAGLESLALIVARPIRTLRPLIALALVEAGILWLLASAQSPLEHSIGADSSLAPVLGLAAFGLLALALRALVRGARYAATTAASHELVPPIPIADPWRADVPAGA
ncbi:MAG: hypothetical protein K8S98_06175 [Planctomycetes bacterium]|nr:hypothetical protein [Planctomycetota bacterium]